jgi:hypothetical protein
VLQLRTPERGLKPHDYMLDCELRQNLPMPHTTLFAIGVSWKMQGQSDAGRAGLIPEISLPVARSSAIWVFELP